MARHRVIQRILGVPARAAIRAGLPPGTTIVIVNWNSVGFLRDTVRAVRSFSPDAHLLVVDNASSDDSQAWLRNEGIQTVRLPRNLGHGLAMDIGFLRCRTEFVVALDVDAFPIDAGWLDRLLAPIKSGSADLSGVHVRDGFVHPCCLAMRTARFVEMGHSFLPRASRPLIDHADQQWQYRGWDVGWQLSLREPRRHLIDRTTVRGPGDIGSAWEGVVYHNFYSTRFGSDVPPSDRELNSGVSPYSAAEAWKAAIAQYLS